MSDRKCVFTGYPSNSRLTIPNHDEHSWAKNVPTVKEYIRKIESEGISILELEACETFYMLEMAKAKYNYLENKLKDIQEQLKKEFDSKRIVTNKQLKEEKQAIKDQKLIKSFADYVEKNKDDPAIKDDDWTWD